MNNQKTSTEQFLDEYQKRIHLYEEAGKQNDPEIKKRATKDFLQIELQRNEYLRQDYLKNIEIGNNLDYLRCHNLESYLDENQKKYNLLITSDDLIVSLKLKLSGMFPEAEKWESRTYYNFPQTIKPEEIN